MSESGNTAKMKACRKRRNSLNRRAFAVNTKR